MGGAGFFITLSSPWCQWGVGRSCPYNNSPLTGQKSCSINSYLLKGVSTAAFAAEQHAGLFTLLHALFLPGTDSWTVQRSWVSMEHILAGWKQPAYWKPLHSDPTTADFQNTDIVLGLCLEHNNFNIITIWRDFIDMVAKISHHVSFIFARISQVMGLTGWFIQFFYFTSVINVPSVCVCSLKCECDFSGITKAANL